MPVKRSKKRSTKRSKKRSTKRSPKTPKVSPSGLIHGTKKKGRDGKMYESVETSTGKSRWKKCNRSCSRRKVQGPMM